MNPFYSTFPETVTVNGEKYRINTDFRDFLFMSDVLESNASDIRKAKAVLSMYKDKIPKDYSAAMMAIADFITEAKTPKDGQEDEEQESRKKLISYEKDAPFIIGDFLRFYDIDLISCKYLHWKKFQLLLTGLPEDAETKKRIAYRDIDTGKIKDKDERARIIRIQKKIAIESMEADEERIGELFGEMMW